MSPKKKELTQESAFLAPRQEPISVEGKLLYCEGDRAWNMIRLKKEILYEFPELKNKKGSFKYKMIIPRSPEKIKKFLEELKNSSDVFPILLYFGKGEIKEEN